MINAFFIALLSIGAILVASHVFFPVLAILMAAGIAVWAVVIGSVVGFCAVVMAMFLVSGAGVLAFVGIAGLWVMGALLLFPFIFPILLPLFVLVLFVAYARRQRDRG